MTNELKTTTLEDVWSVTPPEMAFGTVQFLLDYDVLPESFKKGNDFTKAANQILFKGSIDPQLSDKWEPTPLAEQCTVEEIRNFIGAHLRSWQPKHEHKEAGVGWLLNQFFVEVNPNV